MLFVTGFSFIFILVIKIIAFCCIDGYTYRSNFMFFSTVFSYRLSNIEKNVFQVYLNKNGFISAFYSNMNLPCLNHHPISDPANFPKTSLKTLNNINSIVK